MNDHTCVLIILILIAVLCALTFVLAKWVYPSYAYVPADLEPRKDIQRHQLIPRHIYQTMKSRAVPSKMKQAIDTWIQLNPEYSYHFYNDHRCREFIKDNFDKRILNAYDSLVPGAFKADLWRCCLLYVNGGVYVDVDMVDIIPLRQIISHNDQFISARDQDPKAIYNAFICSTPGHPFLKKMIEYIVDSVENRYYGTSCLEPTGPLGLGKVLQNVLDLDSAFTTGDIYKNGYTFKLLDFPVGQKYIIYRGEPCIKNKYSDYDQNMIDMGQQSSYYNLWLHRKIYK